MKIMCEDATAATQVQLVLEGHGIINGIVRSGPQENDPSVFMMVNIHGDTHDELAIRQDIARIPGVTFEDETAA